MSKQVLDVHQMQHLQELGMKMDYDTLYRYVKFEDTDWLLKPFSDLNIIGISFKYIPAYTLQDVLDALPYKTVASYLHIGKKSFSGDILFYVEYSNFGGYAVSHFRSESLIEAAYEMLCWCIENGHVETDKNK